VEDEALRQEMCRIGALLWERGLIGAAEGNLSARLADGTLLCTPSGLSKGHLRAEDLVVISLEGHPLNGGLPSSEIRLHLGIYRERPDCQAVIHAHPPTATGFSVAEVPFPNDVLPESAVVLGPVVTVPFAMPGTDEVPDSLAPHLPNGKTFLLGHHGAVALGRDLQDAFNRMETLERVARILLTAHALGGPKRIAHPGFERLLAEHLHGRLE
jgi:L-fuculose-phosphate aldolase